MSEKRTPMELARKAERKKLGTREVHDGDQGADRRWASLRKLALADRLPKKYYV